MKIVLVLSLLVSAAYAATVTPMGKVIDMLKDMEVQGEKEKKAEAVQFAAYQQFCEKTEVEKKRIIADSKDKVEVLTAEIEKSGSDAEKLAEEIAGHLAEVESGTAEKEAASKVRETERKDFQAMLKDYTESVDAIGRALKVLKAQAAPKSLVQLKSLELPEHASRGLNALLSEGSEEQLGEPSYEFQSGGVVAMLEKLEDKFLEERLQLEKDETSKKNAFDLLAATLTRKIEQATKEQQQKEGIKAKKLHDKASASGDLSETKVGLKTDEEYLAELVTTCTKKAADFKDRQKVRAEELVAIQEATKAMSEIAKPALLQEGTSLAQLKQSLPDAAQVKVAQFLQKQATEIKSNVLAALAQRARADPMGKVKEMIEKLILRLEDQATAETTKKAWCDEEMKTNKAMREDKSDAASSLQAEKDKLEAQISKLEEDSSSLSTELSELDAALTEATGLRQTEKEKNEATVKEAKQGQEATAKAISVLKEFYAKAGTSFLQTSSATTATVADAPEVFGDEAYGGMQTAKGGVLSMLEVIEADFSRMEAETTASEAAAAKEHDAFVQESKLTKAEKSKEVEHKTSSKREKNSELINIKADLEGTQKELSAAESYYEKLKPDCIDAGPTYAERKAQRDQEMKDLKEALEMLEATAA